jgi:hypothetical protein
MANAKMRKPMKWSKEQFVDKANAFAAGVLGRTNPPPAVDGELAKSLGLAGVAGLNVDLGFTRSESDTSVASLSLSSSNGGSSGGLASLAGGGGGEDDDQSNALWVATVALKELGLALKRDGKRVRDFILAMGQPALLALKADLEGPSSAALVVLDDASTFTVLAAWVTVAQPFVKPAMTRGGSGNSLASLGSSSKLSAGSLTSHLSNGSLACLGEDGFFVEAAPAPSAEEKAQAVARVNAAGQAFAAALAACGGDKQHAGAVYAAQELAAAKAELKTLQASSKAKK